MRRKKTQKMDANKSKEGEEKKHLLTFTQHTIITGFFGVILVRPKIPKMTFLTLNRPQPSPSWSSFFSET